MNQTGIKLNTVSEWAESFRRRVLQSVTCTGILTNQKNQGTGHVQNTNQWNPQNGPNKQQYKTLKNLG